MASAAPRLGSVFAKIDRDVLRTLWSPGGRYRITMAFVLATLAFGIFCFVYQVKYGLGVAGYTAGVMWVTYIVNFVFWVGIAHSGTLISAILYLFRSGWRTTINRSAEAMTIFAVMTAGLFPLIHLGRIWYFFYLIPYPNERTIWPNFRSPLIWDFFAISTYFTISAIFWYTGLVPDLATIRDKVSGLKKRIYGLLSLGWQGTVTEWRNYRKAYLIMAGIATPLVLSVHSVVSWDFAMAIVPGWHSTIFAPYFVAGAIFSGIAMVITLLVPMRWAFGFQDYINEYHVENMAKCLLVTCWIVTYAYIAEYFMAWYSGDPIEWASFTWRATGDYAIPFAIMMTCNVVIPQLCWSRRIRRSVWAMFVISLFVNLGMWYERYVIIIGSLSHEFMPSQWGHYAPTWVEVGIAMGAFAWFILWFMLFAKTLPAVSITEIKEAAAEGYWQPGPAKGEAA